VSRTRASAKQAGASFERTVADYLRDELGQEFIDRAPKHGAKDEGDISNVRDSHGNRIVVECKNAHTLSLPQWTREAETERVNNRALVGVVVHKRHGVGSPGQQWVSMTLDELIVLLKGTRGSAVSDSV
jgi:hypothetical protein